MGAMSNHLEDRVERYLMSFFGLLRAQHLSTETLQKRMSLWDGEYAIDGIPVSMIESELAWREGHARRNRKKIDGS